MARATPSSARLFASVAQPVKTISRGCAPISVATCSRARLTAWAARRPWAWLLDGLPNCDCSHGAKALKTSGATGVVALWSR